MDVFGVAIPFHRNLDYLREAVASVVAQTDPEWRLWIQDDSGAGGSATELQALVASFDDPRIHCESNPRNLGMVANWNRCLDRADTPLVTLLHADDRLLPDYVATMRPLADRYPDAVAAYCGARIIGPTGAPAFSLADAVKGFLVPKRGGLSVLAGEAGATALMRGNFIMCPTLCFRRRRLGERRFDPAFTQVQDLELTVRLLMEGETIVGSSRIGYAYRRHPDSATWVQSESRLRFDEEFRLFDEIAARADALGWRSTARVSRHKRVVKLHLLYRALRAAASGRLAGARDTLGYLRDHWR